MTPPLPRAFAAAFLGITAAISALAAAPARDSAALRLYVGETKVLRLPGTVDKIAIGNGKVLSASSTKDNEVLLVASDAGDSRLTVWLKNKSEVSYDVTVTPSNIGRIAREIQQLFEGDANVKVRTVGERVFFEATDLSTLQVKKVAALEKAYPREFTAIIGGENSLQERTIHMNAQIIEIKKSALDNLGIRWQQSINGPSAGVMGDVVTNRQFSIGPDGTIVQPALPKINPFQWYLGLATAITSSINLLEQRGDAYVVASPQLTSRCGGKADFTAGGELPVPTSTGLGQVNVEYKPYGIRLQIEPICDTQGNIRAKLGTEVSQIDRTVTVLGVPGLLTRKAESELDLFDGKTMILSGLTSLRATEDVDKVPGLGNAPLIGNLFRNRNINGERTELVLLITPTVVTPESKAVLDGIDKGRMLKEETDRRLGNQDIRPSDQPPPPPPKRPEPLDNNVYTPG